MIFQKIYDQSIKIDIYQQYVNILSPYIDKHTNILDVGCGTGKLLSMFQSKTSNVFGIDMDDDMLTYAKQQHPKLRLIKHDMHEPFPFYADIIILSMDVIHYSATPLKVLRHAMDALEEEGIIIFDYFNKSLPDIDETHLHPLTYTWKRTVKDHKILHEVVTPNQTYKFIQYEHVNIDFESFLKQAHFNVTSQLSIDSNKNIIFAKR